MISFDVIVAGGGHAGLEAALAAARMGAKTLLVTHALGSIGVLSCNPSFGGPAKGGLVREVDALGGFCGLGADRAAVQCRILGESKGPATRATRNVVDRHEYHRLARAFAENQPNLSLMEGEAAGLLVESGRCTGLKLLDGSKIKGGAVVLAGGTFWRAVIYHGLKPQKGGRVGEASADFISQALMALGHKIGRLSTSTPPRLKAETVDIEDLQLQPGDPLARPFSTLSDKPQNTAGCRLTWTNEATHRVVMENLATAAFYTGDGLGAGPRYCPSIEDKVKRFPGRPRHQLFIEPDGEGILFPSGLTTGLDPAAQLEMLRTIEGLGRVEMARPGYAIEYDYVEPTGLSRGLESLLVKNLFLAGQINGTSGYEEAAAQGLWAGVNAALKAGGGETLALNRDEALTGVMIDDLTVSGLTEPYRMFTSRAEWRLLLREDNADLRLSPLGEKLGLLDQKRLKILKEKQADLAKGHALLASVKVTPGAALDLGLEIKQTLSAAELLRRPELTIDNLAPQVPGLLELSPAALITLETEVKFDGYIKRQKEDVARLARQENMAIPQDIDFMAVSSLSGEAREILSARRPTTLGQAGRIPGLTPADQNVLAIYLKSRPGPSKAQM